MEQQTFIIDILVVAPFINKYVYIYIKKIHKQVPKVHLKNNIKKEESVKACCHNFVKI